MLGNPGQAFVNIKAQLQILIDHQFLAETVATVNSTDLDNGKSNPVFILTGDTVRTNFFRSAVFFPHQVVIHPELIDFFLHRRKYLHPDRTFRVIFIHQ